MKKISRWLSEYDPHYSTLDPTEQIIRLVAQLTVLAFVLMVIWGLLILILI